VIPIGQAVEGCLVSHQYGLVASTQPKAIAAVIGFIADVGVAWTPRLDAIVVGVGRVVFHEDIAARNPAVEHADKDPVAALGDVIAKPVIIIRTAFDQHGGGIAGVHLAGRAIDANAVGKIVVQKAIAGRTPEFAACIRAVREVVLLNRILVGLDQVQSIPNAVSMIPAENAAVSALEQDTAARRKFAPAMFGIVIVVGEIAVLDQQIARVARH
jgi:hypothetical protein